MRVKADVAELTRRCQEYRQRERDRFAKAKADHPEQLEQYRLHVIAELRQLADRIERGGKLPQSSTNYRDGSYRTILSVPIRREYPKGPTAPDLHKCDLRLAELRITNATELTVDLSSADWSFLRGGSH